MKTLFATLLTLLFSGSILAQTNAANGTGLLFQNVKTKLTAAEKHDIYNQLGFLLAEAVVQQVENNRSSFKPLYDHEITVEEKIHRVATEIYGAIAVEYAPKARQGLKQIKNLGFDHMPVCMAKTAKSLSDDDKKIGRPTDFVVTVREFEWAAGAGFVIPILGDVMRMPGLPATPAAAQIDILEDGKITGLF